eukprot:CAMPEP_0198333918 /NCGR_PEP_ID=MMETSP1450-20131203/19268_1 /TAXON_ID=753684 ORGANISM="Madagascaria erythrocladiodes, Strain CCMP3234" /NCGR_SAMPLE_ID=MMETSP1450 /ASSEMBLY_ACC=CAM_ASM_001115 /LENGTH=501 /DNA_ID=CAMNT_0044038469 /DNA_START=171 /DNA_END=1677 /DNA_ORIENTATION=+
MSSSLFALGWVLLTCIAVAVGDVSFKDVSKIAGIRQMKTDKTSGPAVGDLNQDGWMDIVVSNHAVDKPEVYFGSRNGVFRRSTFARTQQDRHGLAVGDYDGDGDLDVLLSIGGASATNPRPPRILKLNRQTEKLEKVSNSKTKLTGRQRGVAARFVDFDGDGDLDIFSLGRPKVGGGAQHFVYQNLGSGSFRLRQNTGLENGPAAGFQILDFNNDRIPDVLLLGTSSTGLKLFRGDGSFKFTDVTKNVLPSGLGGRSWGGVAEFDLNNDGWFDLYLSAGSKGKGRYKPGDDVLLKNVRGSFVDISKSAGIPKGGAHIGCTIGDFDNNGFVDVFLPRAGPDPRRKRDLMVLNNGDETFSFTNDHGANSPKKKGEGVGAQACDFDNDGRVDLIVADRLRVGDLYGGFLRLYLNKTPRDGNYLVVTLPSTTKDGHSTMDALVTVEADSKKIKRRSSSPGEFGPRASFKKSILASEKFDLLIGSSFSTPVVKGKLYQQFEKSTLR